MTDITRKRGDTYPEVYTLKSKQTNLPMNLEGYTFLLTVDPSQAPATSAGNLLQLEGVILDPAAGSMAFPYTLEDGDAIVPGSYFFDAQMTSAEGIKRTFDAGKYIVQQDITKE